MSHSAFLISEKGRAEEQALLLHKTGKCHVENIMVLHKNMDK